MTWLHAIDPIAVDLPFWPHGIHWYGIMYVLGFAFAWWFGTRRIRAGRLPGVNDEAFGDLIFHGMLGVIVGGRLGYVLFYGMQYALADPLYVLKINEGGMSFHGGLLGVMAGAWLWSRKQKLHYFDTMDFLAPLAPVGLGFGRLGNFIGGELWGKPTGGDWGVIFPSSLPAPWYGQPLETLRDAHAAGALDGFARHPSQLYQAVLEGLVMAVLLLAYSRRPRPRYAVAGWFAILYGLFRFVVEFVRVPDADIGYLAFGWLTMGQVLSLPLLAIGAVLLWLSRSAPTLPMVAPQAAADAAKAAG
jgi:phosphatidylglycerol:prolipoprotein diacylglycerol transferase